MKKWIVLPLMILALSHYEGLIKNTPSNPCLEGYTAICEPICTSTAVYYPPYIGSFNSEGKFYIIENDDMNSVSCHWNCTCFPKEKEENK